MATRPFPPDTLVPYGIPTLQGYESIHPRYSIGEQPAEGLDNSSNTNLGVSLAIFEKEAPNPYAGWKQDDPFPQFGFLTPPSPNSRYMAEGPGGLVPCQVKSESPNRREVEIPAGSERLLFVENWNAGWTATAAGSAPLAVEKTNRHTMAVPLTGNPKTVVLQFHPIWQARGAVISLLAVALLVGLFLARRSPGTSPPAGRN